MLHDMFAVPFDESVDRSPDAGRQLAATRDGDFDRLVAVVDRV